VTEADVISVAPNLFDQQDQEYHRAQRRLESAYATARHQLLQSQLSKLLDARALQLEASASGVSQAQLLAGVKVDPVTDAEVQTFYDANKSRTQQTQEELAPQIRQYLAGVHNDKATRAFYDRLRAKHSVGSALEPYRMQVAATGPARGRGDAPVTIVEFGDFQCPYCQQEEAILSSILTSYQGKVKLIFRHLPLTAVHPDAMTAAKAGVCADGQGKFWEMHDAMYADQRALALDALKATAARLGLDEKRFADCLSDPETAQRIGNDMKAADELGIAATPAFFINGRPVTGSVPADQLTSVIGEELSRSAHGQG
jgi:protein-disulfide isomerase